MECILDMNVPGLPLVLAILLLPGQLHSAGTNIEEAVKANSRVRNSKPRWWDPPSGGSMNDHVADTDPMDPISPFLDVWIIAGQSNAVGWNFDDPAMIPEVGQSWPGRILAFNGSQQWEDAVPNVHCGIHSCTRKDSVGPDMAFARTLIHLGVSKRVGLVPTADSATNLYKQWKPGSYLYNFMVKQTRKAMAAAPKKARLRGMIWVQGESDAMVDEATAAAYGANFEDFVHQARSDLSGEDGELTVILAVMSVTRREVMFPYIQTVRNQQLFVRLPDVVKVDMEGWDYITDRDHGDQWIHLTKRGECGLGILMAYSYKEEVWGRDRRGRLSLLT